MTYATVAAIDFAASCFAEAELATLEAIAARMEAEDVRVESGT
tara:strand:- start:15724 stop:15852 length:129 start_codon:yes stop_codon:yes gene_type:complete